LRAAIRNSGVLPRIGLGRPLRRQANDGSGPIEKALSSWLSLVKAGSHHFQTLIAAKDRPYVAADGAISYSTWGPNADRREVFSPSVELRLAPEIDPR
jgi:hypothetical protein